MDTNVGQPKDLASFTKEDAEEVPITEYVKNVEEIVIDLQQIFVEQRLSCLKEDKLLD